MKNNIAQLRNIIGNTELKIKTLPKNKTLNDILINENRIAVINFLKDEGEEMEELTPVVYQRPHEEKETEPPLPFDWAQGRHLPPSTDSGQVEETSDSVKMDTLQTNHLISKTETSPLLKTIDIPTVNNKTKTKNIENVSNAKLEVVHEHKLRYKAQQNHYYVLGALSQDLSSFPVTMIVEEPLSGRKERTKIDLYERESLRNFACYIGDLFTENSELVETELLQLTDLLEIFREQLIEEQKTARTPKRPATLITKETEQACITFLSHPDLITNIDQQIEKAGVVGEENTRKLLYIIASTYKMNTPLHSLVQGTSGSGKSHLINSIGQCFPPEDVLSMTRVTSKSFYHYNKDELVDKLMLIQDYDGLDEEAQYAFRELQSAGNISSSTTYKDRNGNIVSMVKNVRSHFASLLATTKAEVYLDNMSRSVVIGVDESEAQTQKIVRHQNKQLAGIIDQKEEQKTKMFLQNCMRCIKPYEVVNRYADKVFLPVEAKMLRRLNSHYQAFVKQITILHQYQRKRDEQGRLIAEPQDLKIACDILFDAIMLKVDDLDSSLRQFFDQLKTYIKTLSPEGRAGEGFQFTQREARLALNTSKASCFRYMEDLELLEYVQKVGGYANRGFKYKIVYWDDMEKIRTKIKEELNKQLGQLAIPPLVPGGSKNMNHHNAQQQGE